MLREKLGLDGKEFIAVAAPLFAYLFHKIDQRAFIQHVADKKITDRVLDLVKCDGYIMRNCKLYAWAYHKHRNGGPRPLRKDYGVETEDAAFLRRLNLSHLSMKFETYDVATYEGLVEDALTCSAMQQHIGKLISKKMTFIIRSYGVPRMDIEDDLKAAAIYAMYMQFPRFHSLLHLTNVAKTTIHNTAMSLISYHTSPARQRLYKDAQGNHQAVHEAFDTSVHKMTAGESYMTHVRDHLETIVNLAPKMKPQVQRFLLCAAGHFDEEFSRFLKIDNSAAVDAMAYSRYLNKARKFFGFSEENVERIFVRLKSHLTA